MAKSFILRPSADISGGDGTSYLKINEVKADDQATILSVIADEYDHDDKDVEKNYIFALSGDVPNKKIKILHIDVVGRANVTCDSILYGGARIDSTLILEEKNAEAFNFKASGSNDLYETSAISINPDVIGLTKASDALNLTLSVSLRAWASYNDGMAKGGGGAASITQVYVEIFYEEITNIGIYDKVGGKQKAATATYQKVNGKWTDIPEDEAKTIIKNNTIRRG